VEIFIFFDDAKRSIYDFSARIVHHKIVYF